MSDVVFFAGAENGAITESPNTAAVSVDTTQHNLYGAYSYKFNWSSGGAVSTANGLGLTDIYARCYVFASLSGGTPGETNEIVSIRDSTNADIGSISLVNNVSSLQLMLNDQSSTQIGSAVTLNSSEWHRIELQVHFSASSSVIEALFDGAVFATGTQSNTNQIYRALWGSISGVGTATGSVWIDDICLRTAQYPGAGYCIARQPNTTAPSYNTWTLNGGAGSISAAWNSTPFSAVTSASSATSGNNQTGVMDFTITGATGSTGFGSGVVDTNDIINAVKIGWEGKTSSITTDGVDSSIFRTAGLDTLTAGVAYLVTDSFQQTLLSTTPSPSQVMSCEAGISKGTGTNTHTVEDLWMMIDWTPVAIPVSRMDSHSGGVFVVQTDAW